MYSIKHKNNRLFTLIIAGVLSVSFQTTSQAAPPPVAEIIPKHFDEHGSVRTDNYYWLNERENPKVIDYLNAENDYTRAQMAHTEDFQNTLYEEIKGRIKQTDLSVPYRYNDYFYYSRNEDGKEYKIYCRKKGSLDAPEEIMIDANLMAEGHEYFAVRGQKISSDQNLIAFATDTVGRRIYTIQFKNLETGELLPDKITSATSNVVWANDNKTVFYSRQDLETLRWDKVYRHVLGTDESADELIYEELDETFGTWVYKTKSEKFLIIENYHTLSGEARYLDADTPQGEFTMFQERELNHEYSIDHAGDRFYIRTNHEAENFRLMSCMAGQTARTHWTEEVGHRDDVFLEGFEVFKDFLVVEERKNGLIELRIRPWAGGDDYYLEFDEAAYLAYTTDNYTYDTKVLRYGYASMVSPRSTFDYDMSTRKKTLLKQEEVLGGYDASKYRVERLYATARDSAIIPISILRPKDLQKDGSHPLMLYAYGSYGHSMDASFRSHRFTLVERGFSYAIAHVRGGQEMGRKWYEDGKLLKKKNTFTDFIDCADFLVKQKYTSADRLFANGGSAGGLLMGAIVNMRSDLFKGVVADVPFVDVITTMMDASIPLTTGEYDEWGNPESKEYYDYMLSYSPYDQVKAQDYCNILITTGLHDSQVQYFEPAKWVAKLRALKTNDNRLLLKIEMEAGHGGASGRYKRYKEYAFMYAFVLDLAGINK